MFRFDFDEEDVKNAIKEVHEKLANNDQKANIKGAGMYIGEEYYSNENENLYELCNHLFDTDFTV